TLVFKLYTAAWVAHLSALLPALGDLPGIQRIVLRLNRQLQAIGHHSLSDGMALTGEPLNAPLIFTENHLRFEADARHGHKTGFFCDHRDNRAKVRELSRGKRVLDVFAYSGAFSLYAAAGGAVEVTSV